MSSVPHRPVLRARITLFLLTSVWGSTFIANDRALHDASPLAMMVLRFFIASTCIAVIKPKALRDVPKTLLPALTLSLSNFAGFAFQNVGLADSTPSRSAFFTSLFVVFVPIFESVRTRKLPRPALIVAVVLALVGVGVMNNPFGGHWTRGDTLTVLCAVAFAVYIIEIARLSGRFDVWTLTLTQMISITVFSAIFTAFEPVRLHLTPAFIGIIIYLALICTAATFVVMTYAQREISATEASIIYTLEPPLATLFSVIIGREKMTLTFVVGAAIILVATLVAALSEARASNDPLAPSA